MNYRKQLEAVIPLLDHWLAYKVYALRIPGLTIGLVHKDTILFQKGYGYANLETRQPVTETTCFRIASFSKIFTTLAIMKLFEEGRINLDSRVEEYLSWWKSEQEETALITIRQLLSHTSGLNRDGNTAHWCNYEFPDLETIQSHLAQGAMVYSPTTTWKYSNFAFTILGAVISAITQETYAEYIQKAVLQPLGLKHTFPDYTEQLSSQLAIGYRRNLPETKRTPFPSINTQSMASATGFISNVTDLCHMMSAQFDNNTRLLKNETKREMRRIQWLCKEIDSDWCLGYETWKVNNRRIDGHGGAFQGYKSRFGMDIERSIGIVILTNAIDAPALGLLDSTFHLINEIIANFDQYTEEETGDLTPYQGYYRNSWGDTIISAINKRLVIYNPNLDLPTREYSLLDNHKKHQFNIRTGCMGYAGELARFDEMADGAAQQVWIGPNPSQRFTLPS